MKILLASSEVHPFSKTGGLADMVGALGKALAAEGHEVFIVTPLYRGIRGRFTELRRVGVRVEVVLGEMLMEGEVWELRPRPGLRVWFVEQQECFDRLGLYGENNADYPDNAVRFTFFSKAVVQIARLLPGGAPDIVHVHDWQAALVPALLRREGHRTGWTPPRSVLTVHNLAYQGRFAQGAFALTNLPGEYFTMDGVEFYGDVNFLKAGIVYADMITTVSPRYAREICTEAYGCGLDDRLRARGDRLAGILNGVDYDEWSTHRNIHLKHPYSFRKMGGKAATKHDLQRELGLPARADVPLFATVTRLADQKGMDILLGALEEMLAKEMQFVLLGSGDPALQRGYQNLARRHPTKVTVRIGYDHALSHRIEAGCDFFLMPSRFEPCGLNQMYSLRYGAIPIVRRTGGLDDSVVDLTEDEERADGIKFTEFTTRALTGAIRKALVLHDTPHLLAQMRKNAMTADFSWSRTTQEYTQVYQRALAG
ncbi:MAG: glycogen synthase GlgA [Verrucomicrobia bacterium]|nr:glycogen synthase GlgA [Verrucomicrobiota bacterium]